MKVPYIEMKNKNFRMNQNEVKKNTIYRDLWLSNERADPGLVARSWSGWLRLTQ